MIEDLQDMGEKVYKYSSVCDYTLRNIEDDTIAFTHIDCLNDPFEGIGRVVCSEEDIDVEYFASKGIDLQKMISDKLSEKKIERIRNEYRVLCVTTSSNNPLMWSHYADNHRGICLEYDVREIREIATDTRCVKYDSTISTVGLNSNNVPDFIFHKYDVWRYEEEIRAIYHIGQGDVEYLDYYENLELLEGDKNDRYTYFADGRATMDNLKIIKVPKVILRQCKITGIYLGLRISDENRKKILAIAENNKKDVWQMIQKRDSYSLDKCRII